MNARERLQKVQAELKQRKSNDVKFFLSVGGETPLSVVAAEAADALEAFLAGRVEAMPKIGDSAR